MKTRVLTLIAGVVTNSCLLPTTGDILSAMCIVFEKDAIEHLKYIDFIKK